MIDKLSGQEKFSSSDLQGERIYFWLWTGIDCDKNNGYHRTEVEMTIADFHNILARELKDIRPVCGYCDQQYIPDFNDFGPIKISKPRTKNV